MRTLIVLAAAIGVAVPALAAGPSPVPGGLAPPIRIEAEGGPIDVTTGHAAPFVVDWNRDGLFDLLVGQFGGGKLRIYLNTGTKDRPRFGKHEIFQAGGAEGTVPAG